MGVFPGGRHGVKKVRQVRCTGIATGENWCTNLRFILADHKNHPYRTLA